MAMLKRLRRQFSGGHLGSNPRLAGSSSGRRLLPRLGSLNSLTSADGTAKKSRQAHKKGGGQTGRQSSKENIEQEDLYTHDAAGRRTLDRLITTRQWDRIEELLSTDDGRDYIKSVSMLLDDADTNTTTTTKPTTTAPTKFISIFHHIVLANPPPQILSDLIHLIGVSQLLRRDDIRAHYAVGYGSLKLLRHRAARRSSNSARITHEGMAWTPLHTAVAFCVSDDDSTNNNTTDTTTNTSTYRLSDILNHTKKPKVEPATVHVLLRHFPALPSITCGKTSITPLMIEVAKGPHANMRLCKRMVDACPTSILITDKENRTAVEYALGGENLRLYRNLHHLYNDEMQKMNGLESRKRMAHSLMASGSSGMDLYGSGSSGMDLHSAAGGGNGGDVGDVRKRREGSLTGLHSRAVREAAKVVAQDELKEEEEVVVVGGGSEEESESTDHQQRQLEVSPKHGEMKRSSSRSSNRSSTSAAA